MQSKVEVAVLNGHVGRLCQLRWTSDTRFSVECQGRHR